jgi:conjugative transfer region lipoprotein (TIGR03751 family)
MASSRYTCAALLPTLAAASLLAGCSITGPRHSPISNVTQGSPTVLDIYRGQGVTSQSDPGHPAPRALLRRQAPLRPVAVGDDDTQRYWSALEPMRQRFARLPNPDLVMVVFPHLSAGQYPVPGYVTVFPMYTRTEYALPGEVRLDLAEGRAAYGSSAAKAAPGKER